MSSLNYLDGLGVSFIFGWLVPLSLVAALVAVLGR